MSKKDLEEVYKAVVDRVKSRITKAQSTAKKTKKKGLNIEALADSILNEIGTDKLEKFPEEYANLSDCKEIKVKDEGEPIVDSNLFEGFHVKIGDQIIKCIYEDEARYVRYAILNGHTTVMVPKERSEVKRAVGDYGNAFEKTEKKINEILGDSIPDRKIRERVKSTVWKKLLRKE